MKQLLTDIFEEDFDIQDVFSDVSEDSERQYKTNCYKWLHKINSELNLEQVKAVENLQNIEVFQNYTTFIDMNKHEDYLKIPPNRLVCEKL